MPSQHIDLSLLSASAAAAAAAASERDAIHHAAGYQTNLRQHSRRRRLGKLVSPVGAQIVQRPGTAAAYIGMAASG